GAEHGGLNGERQISIGKNDKWIFPAHFALAFFHAARALGVEFAANLVRASERNGTHVGMLEKFIADFTAGAHDHIQNARRDARLLEYFHDFGAGKRRQGGGLEDYG